MRRDANQGALYVQESGFNPRACMRRDQHGIPILGGICGFQSTRLHEARQTFYKILPDDMIVSIHAPA